MAATPPQLGVVSDFDSDKGYGTVRSDDGAYFFHCTQIADGSRSIDVGCAVAFVTGPGAPGRWEAFGVVKLG